MSPVKKTKSLNIRLSEDEYQMLLDLCTMYGMDKTAFIANLLRHTLKTKPEFVISPSNSAGFTNDIGITAAQDPGEPKNSL